MVVVDVTENKLVRNCRQLVGHLQTLIKDATTLKEELNFYQANTMLPGNNILSGSFMIIMLRSYDLV